MIRVALTALTILGAPIGAWAQTLSCYPRIGAYHGDYGGYCPGSALRWSVKENTIGAFGRNCRGEPWSYDRLSGTYINHKTSAEVEMDDCFAPTRGRYANNRVAFQAWDALMRFHAGAGHSRTASVAP